MASFVAAAARDVAAATSRGLVPDGPDAEDSDGAAIATDKVLDENGIEEGILEKGTKKVLAPPGRRGQRREGATLDCDKREQVEEGERERERERERDEREM